MYEDNTKTGKVICVYKTGSGCGSSSFAALLSAALSVKGQKTLLMCPVADNGLESSSMISRDIDRQCFEEVVRLEISNALTGEMAGDYATQIGNRLYYTTAKSDVLVKNAAEAVKNMVEIFGSIFDYIVIESPGDKDFDEELLKYSDIVFPVITQNLKVLNAASKLTDVFDDEKTLTVCMNYNSNHPINEKLIKKYIGSEFVVIREDFEFIASTLERRVLDFAEKTKRAITEPQKGFFGKRKDKDIDEQDISLAYTDISNIISEIGG